MLLVRMRDGSFELCIVYGQRNEVTTKNRCMLSRKDNRMDLMRFSVML